MRKVVTINKKIEFDSELSEVQTSVTRILMNGINNDVETKVYPQPDEICGYKVFNIKFYKKYNVVGIVNGSSFESILREYTIPVLVSNEKKYVLSYSTFKGIIARAAFKRIRKDTKVKCSPVKIDLVNAYNCITQNVNNVTVYSGWFSKLGTQLQNALLQGNGVDGDADWNKYKRIRGSELKNIQFKFDDDKYPTGSVVIFLSSRGFIFTNSRIGEEDFFEIVEKIVNALDTMNIIKDADEEDEEDVELIVDDQADEEE